MQTCQVTYLGGDYYIKSCSGAPLLDEVSGCVGGGVGEDVEDVEDAGKMVMGYVWASTIVKQII